MSRAALFAAALLPFVVSACTADHLASKRVDAPKEPLTKQALSATPQSPAAGPDPDVVWVLMKEQADLTTAKATPEWAARGTAVHDALLTTAKTKQTSIQSFLSQRKASFKQFWIVNALRVRADKATTAELAQRPDVAQVVPDRIYTLPPLKKTTAVPRVNTLEWGIASIRAGEAWDTFGTRGEDIVVASIDSGVQFDHPAVQRQYRGNLDGTLDHNYNWFDPSSVCGSPSLAPCDNAGHGTHTMGTMVGDDGDPGENQIGVAPHARWIAAKGCESSSCTEEALLSAAEWILAPTDLKGENPRPDLRPNIVNNSWGGGSGDTFFQAAVQAWVAAGIFPVFSAGNSGPSCGSANSPGDYPESYAVAAYDVKNTIAPFSSRGPATLGASKPNIAGPGVAVRSSVPGNEYDVYDGTSMAAPHLAGTVALLWSAAPALVGDIEGTRAVLDMAAVDTADTSCGGTDGNNGTWGEGRLDAYATLDIAPRGSVGSLVGTVSAAGGAAIEKATVIARAMGARDRTTSTNAMGAYSVRLTVGTFDVEARAFGYLAQKVSGVQVTENASTTQNFSLTVAPKHPVSGVVRDDSGAPIAGATVTLVATPLAPVLTDASGQYQLADVPEGEYSLLVGGSHCYTAQTIAVVVAASVTQDVTLPKRFDAYGYSCTPTTNTYVQASDVLISTGDDQSTSLKLPFPFVYYGLTYESVFVSVNGLLYFAPGSALGFNTSIPSPEQPNAAIYGLWDDLYLDANSTINTQTLGNAPNRQVVVEWRGLLSYDEANTRFNFEIVLNETGQIGLHYAPADASAPLGATATIGIEDAAGKDGLLYSYNETSLSTGSAVRYALPPSGIIQGTVTDANDGLPLAAATIVAKQGDKTIRSAQTDAKGVYRLQVPVGTYNVSTAPKRYIAETREVAVTENAVVEASFALKSPGAIVAPATIEVVTPTGQTRTRQLTLTNNGSAPLTWSLSESGGAKQALTVAKAVSSTNVTASSSAAHNSHAVAGALPTTTGWATLSPGDVLAKFTPSSIQQVWGVGFDGNVWLSDASALANASFTPDGTATGVSFPTPWAGFYPGDMAYDSSRKLMCQVNVGGDNGIYCWDPTTGAVVDTISGSFPWAATPQRGLAYNPNDDTFYVGGWTEGIIYHVQGSTHADKGAVIAQCTPPDPNISGLAWNASMGVLWEATNSETDGIFELNPDDCTVLSTVAHPEPGFHGGGLELDALGNLWLISQASNTAFLVDSGVPSFSDVPWINTSPASGTLAAGQSQVIDVKVDTTGLEPGVYLASVFINSDAGRTPSLRVPVSLVVTAYQQAVESGGGNAYTDTKGETWAADQAYAAGSWGFLQDSRTFTTSHKIEGTTDPQLYTTVRIDPFGYRFDGVPNGVYQIELRFAQLRDLDLGDREFDVIVENTTVLPAYDPAFAAGDYVADDHSFFIAVADGQLDVRFATRVGQPIINALRVTHRPDR